MKAIINKDGVQYEASEIEPQSDWLYDYPLRIVAPKALALVYPEIYIWFQINDLPIEKVGDMVHLYCNEILPDHQGLIDANASIISVECSNIRN